MASPFRIFRKHQKTLLVAAGVVAIFVFVLGDSLMQFVSRSPRGGSAVQFASNAVAVRWDSGSLTNQELYHLVVRRRFVNAFIQGVEYAGRQAAVAAGVEPRPLRVQPIVGAETPQQGVEQDVVRTKLFGDAARQAGMRVSDEAVVGYLDELGRQQVSRDDMRAMLNRLQPGGMRASIDYVIDALREEMLARNFVASYQYGLETVTPEQRWKDWLMVNDRVVLEAAGIPVESFVVDVKEPTEDELDKFFNEVPFRGSLSHKDREPQPDFLGTMEFPSPTPGFAIPRKIDVQFIEADYDQFLTKVEGEITDEEIQKYYDENKDPLFIKAETGLIDEAAEKPAAEEAHETTTETDATAPADEAGEAATEPDATAPAEDAEAGVTPEAGATEEPQPPTEDEPQPPEDAGSGEAAPAEEDQSSRDRAPRSGVFHLAAFLQEAESGDAAGATAADPAASAADDRAAPSETDAAAETAAPNGQEPAAAPVDASTTAAAPAAEKPKEFQPLDEVRDVIRRRLAEQRVSEQLTAQMTQLESLLNGEFTKYFSAQLDAEAAERDPPARPAALVDLAPLAAQHGLKHGQTGPMSWLELRNTPVGESGDIESHIPLWRILFGSKDLDLYQPKSTEDLDANRYLAMKTSDTPRRVPALAEVRDDVVRAWKLQKAADLALKRAKEFAKKAQDAKATLGDAFADEKSVEVVVTDPFSWFTGGDVGIVNGQFQQQPFRLSEPDGIVAAGPAFLERVFELEDGAVGAALNHDRSIAYIIRIAEHDLSPDELRTAYLAEANTWPGLRIMTSGHARTAAQLLVADILAGAGLEWVREPDQPPREEEEAE